MSTLVPRGRSPVQARAKARVDTVLDAAAAMLLADGVPLNLTAVAERAGVSIGSLYQYFPSHAALVRGLAERHLDRVGGAIIETLIRGPVTVEQLEAALRAYLALADDELAVAVMRAIAADPALRALDRADTARNVTAVTGAMAAAGLPAGAQVRTQVELAIELAGALVLVLAERPARLRRALVDEFVAATLAHR